MKRKLEGGFAPSPFFRVTSSRLGHENKKDAKNKLINDLKKDYQAIRIKHYFMRVRSPDPK